jgi:uncharacterized membrane protein
MISLLSFLGHLHPLLVHLPIGILILAVLLEFWQRFILRTTTMRAAIQFALLAGAVGATLSAGTGYLLAEQQTYDGDTLFWHRWLGIATALSAWVIWYFNDHRFYFPVLCSLVLMLSITGHFGGVLTHGENYLWEPFEQNNAQVSAVGLSVTPETPVFTGIIQPILQAKCVSCHKTGKTKGGLNLESLEGLFKGGENGPILLAGKPSESELLRRIHLPAQEEEHMPPKGKTQLTADELKLIAWWVEQGADSQKKVADYTLPEEIKSIFSNKTHQSPVFNTHQPAPNPASIKQLKSLGVSINRILPESNFLSVSLAGNQRMSPEMVQALQSISTQITWLDLAHSNLNDAWLQDIGPMPSLIRLNLSSTAITDAGLANLPKSLYLEYLNLMGTNVTDAGLSSIFGLTNLKTLYTWNSAVTNVGLQGLKQKMPTLDAVVGPEPDTSTTPLRLKSPKMLFGRTIFDDTLQVSLDFPFKGVDLYYTLDEASPTTQSIKYRNEPIVLHESTRVRAIASRKGWADSEITEAMFAKRKYKPAKASLDHAPSPKYAGSGGAALIDGLMGEVYSDKAFIGYEGEHVTTIIEFDKVVDISRVNIHCIENNNAWIFLPKSIQVWTSVDGKNYQLGAQAAYAMNSSMNPEKTHLLSLAFKQDIAARYLKIRLESPLKNPKWHPGAGQKCWIFMDEVLVE